MADKLANEFGINVAIPHRDPKTLLQAIDGLGKRIGACADIGDWMESGIKPADGLAILKERLIAVHLRDRSALGKDGRDVILGTGVAGIESFIGEIYRMGLTPSVITVKAAGTDLTKSFDALEHSLRTVAADRVAQIGRTTPVRGPERMRAQNRERIIAGVRAAVPAEAQAKPAKPRKLLVVDLNVAYPGHGSIPAANMAIELWGKNTGAYEAVFSNDLDNLKYPRTKEFYAVFLNNTVGQIFPDPQVRDGLMRFIREGGGLGGYHGTPHASIDWTEFGDMLAARAGSHRAPTEKVTVKIDDPKSPLTAAFGGAGFEFQDECFRFTSPPYSREKVHVLLSFDTQRTDLHQLPNCDICVRPDNDYPISWIRSVGKGRIFYATVGHNPTVFEMPAMAKFFLDSSLFWAIWLRTRPRATGRSHRGQSGGGADAVQQNLNQGGMDVERRRWYRSYYRTPCPVIWRLLQSGLWLFQKQSCPSLRALVRSLPTARKPCDGCGPQIRHSEVSLRSRHLRHQRVAGRSKISLGGLNTA